MQKSSLSSTPAHRLPAAGYLFLAFASGLGLASLLASLLPQSAPLRPANAILASFAVELLSLGVLLSLLPGKAEERAKFAFLRAWLKSVVFSGAALTGIAAAPSHHEPLLTFLALWILFAGQAAAIAAFHILLALFMPPAPVLARQITLIMVSALVAVPFWSKEPILRASPSAQVQSGSHLPQLDWPAAAMQSCPLMAVASAWYTESAAARANDSGDPAQGAKAEGGRLDLVHGDLTYKVWLGSYMSSRYSYILPRTQEDAFAPGLAASLLIWGLPLLVFGEALFRFPPRQ